MLADTKRVMPWLDWCLPWAVSRNCVRVVLGHRQVTWTPNSRSSRASEALNEQILELSVPSGEDGGELETLLGIQQPTLSQQLAVLRREGLVQTRREGKQIHYRICSPAALAVINTLYQLFCVGEPQ